LATPKHPTLYRLAGNGRSIRLLFGRCPRCAALTFPATAYGCSACGAAPLAVEERDGEGVLQAVVTLHAAVMPGLPVPQAIGDVEIAPGIIEEVLLEGAGEDYAPGMRVVARAHALEDDFFDCRFAPEDRA
jgi:uncharacterized OB-fold protein